MSKLWWILSTNTRPAVAVESPHGASRHLAGGLFHLSFWVPLAVCTWLALIPDPPDNPVFRLGDVILHGAAFTYLTFALMLVQTAGNRRSFPAMAAVACTALLGYGLLLELAQSFIPERTAELKDILVDGAGIVVGLALAALLARPICSLAELILGRIFRVR